MTETCAVYLELNVEQKKFYYCQKHKACSFGVQVQDVSFSLSLTLSFHLIAPLPCYTGDKLIDHWSLVKNFKSNYLDKNNEMWNCVLIIHVVHVAVSPEPDQNIRICTQGKGRKSYVNSAFQSHFNSSNRLLLSIRNPSKFLPVEKITQPTT